MNILKIFKNNYLFLVLFIILILKQGIINLINIDMKDNNTSYELLMAKYNKLLEFNNIDYVYNEDYINSYIIFKDIYDYQNEITIKGGKDYNLNNNPIIYNNTLLGIIDKVYNNYSKVNLLTNNKTNISVKINDSIGLLYAKNNKLYVKNIDNYSNISIGDSIYTSGIGKINENIYIGKVKNINLNNMEIEKIIEVEYELNIKDIDYITILGVQK